MKTDEGQSQEEMAPENEEGSEQSGSDVKIPESWQKQVQSCCAAMTNESQCSYMCDCANERRQELMKETSDELPTKSYSDEGMPS